MKIHFATPIIFLFPFLFASCVREPLSPNPADEQLYGDANDAQSQADYGVAKELYQELIQKHPSSMRYDNAILGLAECQRALGRRDSAVFTLRTMPTGSVEYGPSLLLQGQWMIEDMQYWPSDSAPAALRQAIHWNGDQAVVGEAWYSLGQAFYKMVSTGSITRGAYYDSALVAYGTLRESYPNHIRFSDAAYRIGWTLYQKGSWTRAADTLNTYARDYDESPLADGALYWAAKALGNAGEDCAAKALMLQMLEQYPYTDKRVLAEAEIQDLQCP